MPSDVGVTLAAAVAPRRQNH